MKVQFISDRSYPEFEIYEEDRVILHIKIDIKTQAFRIKYRDSRRVFFIVEDITKKTKTTTLLNEYSQQLGLLTTSKTDTNRGEIEIEGVQYLYKINDGFIKEITLSIDDTYHHTLNCKLEITELSSFYKNYLLFAFAWFTFLTKEQATSVQFAEA